MKKLIILVIAGILVVNSIPSVKSWGDCYHEWRFDIESGGTVHIEVDIHLREVDFSLTSWNLAFDMKWYEKITNMKAYETKTKKELEIDTQKTSKTLRYFFIFEEIKSQEDFDFTVEFDVNGAVSEPIDGVNYFEWSVSTSENFMRHEMDVALPAGTEAVFVTEATPVQFSGTRSVKIHFVEESKGLSANVMGVAFSDVGVYNLEKAEKAFNAEEYKDAVSYYEKAYQFYESLSILYGASRDEFFGGLSEDPESTVTPTYFIFSTNADYSQFLGQLRDKIAESQEKIEEKEQEAKETEADNAFSDAQALFASGDYEAAQNAFKEAQDLYAALNNDEKVNECEDYIDQCTQFIEIEKTKKEANTVFEEGVSLYEQGQYEEAKAAFEKALALYEDIGDTEKSQECRQWITSCEEKLESSGSCVGTGLLVFLVAAGVLCFWQNKVI